MKLVYSSKNRMLVSGCSWTQESKMDHKRDWRPHWPSMLAKKLKKKYINFGRSGAGNQFIYNQVVDQYNGEDLICVLWSGFDRWDFLTDHTMSGTQKEPRKVWDALDESGFIDPIFNLKRSLRFIHAFQNFCEVNKIKYIHGLAINGQDFWRGPHEIHWQAKSSRRTILSEFIGDRLHEYLKEQHFIGWPIYYEFDGYCMSDYLNRLDKTKTELRVSKTDQHPNGKGHEIIANLFYDRYIELYGEL